MDAEIVITGLCSILNPFGESDYADPGVIVVRTDGHQHGPEHDHIGFLAYDTKEVELTISGSLPPMAIAVPNSSFSYVPLDGYELVINGNPPDVPKPTDDHSFRDLVAHRDEYWPEASGDFDRAIVPEPGSRPQNVRAWMRFGKGKIGASRVSKVPWRFTNSSGLTLQRHFAEEVVYSEFPYSGDGLTIRLLDLESEKEKAALTFKLKNSSLDKPLTLMIGNSTAIDLLNTLEHQVTERVDHPYSTHWAFLNYTSTLKDGPIPIAINPPDDGNGGGGSGGACGPGSGNGRPKS